MDEDEIDYSTGHGAQATGAMDPTDEADTSDEEMDTEAQPAAAAPAQPLVMRGGGGAVQVPSTIGPQENAEQLANRAMWQQLQYRFANSPLSETEAAVGAALKYQALRAYQNAVATGVSPGRALSRVAPLLYGGRESNLGHAANFIRATAPEKPRLMDVGGTLYRDNGDGSVTAITGGRQPAQRANQFDLAEYNSTLRALAKVREDSDRDIIGSESFKRHQAELALLQGRLQDLRTRSQATPPNPIPGTRTATAPAGPGGFVRVRHPDGRFGVVPRSNLPRAQAQGFRVLGQ